MVEPLGERIPLIPPIGEAYVAGAAPDVVDHWLAKVHPQDEELLAHYRARLAAVARNGVAVSLLGEKDPNEYAALQSALREYGEGQLTPARERAFRQLLAETRCFFADVELVADQTYTVGGIVAPVRNPEGDISMVLRVTQLPGKVTGEVLAQWMATVKAAAADVERDLARKAGKVALQDYRDWYAEDFPM
jgi:hypothetical protein